MVVAEGLEHLSPHDLVTYSRCPYEMELHRVRRAAPPGLQTSMVRTPPGTRPLHQSPLFSPPTAHVLTIEGRLDLLDGDRLAYVDGQERGLPVLFPPERVDLDPRFSSHGPNLIDPELGLSGRPDFIMRRASGSLVPIEFKRTHLFVGLRPAHGRQFDIIQAIAECRLVQAVTGERPPFGIVLYGDSANEGEHEGWMQVPYGASEEAWLRAAVLQIRSDAVRAPVPSERTCAHCEPNRDGMCGFAAVRPAADYESSIPFPQVRR